MRMRFLAVPLRNDWIFSLAEERVSRINAHVFTHQNRPTYISLVAQLQHQPWLQESGKLGVAAAAAARRCLQVIFKLLREAFSKLAGSDCCYFCQSSIHSGWQHKAT